MTRLGPICAALVAAATLLPPLAFSHSGATGVVRERMEAMESIAKAMKRIKAQLDATDIDRHALATDAAAIVGGGAEDLLPLFPVGSFGGVSEAHVEIWEDWDTFSGIAKDMEVAAEYLADMASAGADKQELMRGFGALTKTCRDCHSEYRIKK